MVWCYIKHRDNFTFFYLIYVELLCMGAHK
jgi:hypothetical protein